MAPDSRTWTPPVLFHFSVEFQWKSSKASASFAEVDGLGQELVFENIGDSSVLVSGVKTSDVVLKRALEPLNERITVWIKNTFRFQYGARIKPCNMIVSLLDERGDMMAGWICERAFPVKWSVDTLNASESKIAVESITLHYDTLRRSL